ncbi:hypothetical protein QBC38DRAFT_519815 [Podospora fimiseda]|uniref:Uncharacterized protein n=1 Tax=Podospora fimiseda TaxID=252190 RepID=A0AAN7BZJ0_9PEZI|nr:hypothetical protein QBC38DRAFT_519815 [Podospora fimiseda]
MENGRERWGLVNCDTPDGYYLAYNLEVDRRKAEREKQRNLFVKSYFHQWPRRVCNLLPTGRHLGSRSLVRLVKLVRRCRPPLLGLPRWDSHPLRAHQGSRTLSGIEVPAGKILAPSVTCFFPVFPGLSPRLLIKSRLEKMWGMCERKNAIPPRDHQKPVNHREGARGPFPPQSHPLGIGGLMLGREGGEMVMETGDGEGREKEGEMGRERKTENGDDDFRWECCLFRRLHCMTEIQSHFPATLQLSGTNSWICGGPWMLLLPACWYQPDTFQPEVVVPTHPSYFFPGCKVHKVIPR